jgi:hypothetical protein
MTEAEWNECADPQPMLEFLRGKASDRRLRLFAVACCRRISHLMTYDGSRQAVDVAERFADALAGEDELRIAFSGSRSTNRAEYAASCACYDSGVEAGEYTWGFAADAVDATKESRREEPSRHEELSCQAVLLRDIFGPLPFRPITLDPSLRTPTVKQLAEAIYQEGAFDRMPVLADALEEAGCNQQDILGHLRSGGDHVRGCWAVDTVMGRS